MQTSRLVPLFLCARRPNRGGLLEMLRDGGLWAGSERAILGQINRDNHRQFRSDKMRRRTSLRAAIYVYSYQSDRHKRTVNG
jgi:hypothetical protein